jgi:hypothetical protein
MSERHTIGLNPVKHQDAIISALFEKHGKGRSFAEFTKDILFELGLLSFRGDDIGLLSLVSTEDAAHALPRKNRNRKSQSRKNSLNKQVKTQLEKKEAEKEDNEKETSSDETGTVSSDDVLKVGNFE